MKFFKQSDFDPEDFSWWGNAHSERAAEIANAKLEKESKIVYLNWGTNRPYDPTFCCNNHSHRALLINIEPIEKCTHPKEKVKTFYWCVGKEVLDPNDFTANLLMKCDCGARVECETFRAIDETK